MYIHAYIYIYIYTYIVSINRINYTLRPALIPPPLRERRTMRCASVNVVYVV